MTGGNGNSGHDCSPRVAHSSEIRKRSGQKMPRVRSRRVSATYSPYTTRIDSTGRFPAKSTLSIQLVEPEPSDHAGHRTCLVW